MLRCVTGTRNYATKALDLWRSWVLMIRMRLAVTIVSKPWPLIWGGYKDKDTDMGMAFVCLVAINQDQNGAPIFPHSFSLQTFELSGQIISHDTAGRWHPDVADASS